MPIINNGSQHDRIMALQNQIQYAAKMIEKQAIEDKKLVRGTLTGIEYSRYTPVLQGPSLFTPEELEYVLSNNKTNDAPINVAIPENLTAILSGDYATQANVSWVPYTGPSSYSIRGYTIIAINTTDNTETSYVVTNSPYTLTGLTTGKSYTFKIRSENGRPSEFSPETSPIIAGTIAQPVITSVEQTDSGNKKVNFSVAYGARISNISYKLYKATVTGVTVGSYTSTTINNSGALQFTGVIIELGTKYNFYVTYINTSTNEESSPSDIIEVTGAGLPGPVSVPTVTAGDTYITLSWVTPTTGGSTINSYIISAYYSDNTPASTKNTSDASTSFNYTGLLNGVSYKFKIQAVNNIGTGTLNSNYSSSIAPVFTIQTPTNVVNLNDYGLSSIAFGYMRYSRYTNRLFVTDTNGQRPLIVSLDINSNVIGVSQITCSNFNTGNSYGIDVDSDENIYICGTGTGRIYKFTNNNNNTYTQSTLIANGTINNPSDIVLDSTNTYAYVTEEYAASDQSGPRVFRINITDPSPTATVLFTLTGQLRGIVLDSSDNMYIVGHSGSTDRKIYKATYDVNGDYYNTPTVYAGTGAAGLIDGRASEATFSAPFGITISQGNIIVLEKNDGLVRMIYTSSNDRYVARLPLSGIVLNSAMGITVDSNNNIYIANRGSNPPTIVKFRI